MTIRHRKTASLSSLERADLERILGASFGLLQPAETVVEAYCRKVRSVAIGCLGGNPVAFQFYQSLDLDGHRIVHFSLGGKMSVAGPGVQRRLGRSLLLRSFPWLAPWRRVAAIGVCNHPKTYRSMITLGRVRFPDVEAPGREFPAAGLYARAIQTLGIEGVDQETGLIEGRAASVGVLIPEDAYEGTAGNPLFERIAQYQGGELDRGLCTMVLLDLRTALGGDVQRLASSGRRVGEGSA